MNFIPLKDFYSEETKSQYIAGLKYSIRTTRLLGYVEKWAGEGLVTMGRGGSNISGIGEVKERKRSWRSLIRRLLGRE